MQFAGSNRRRAGLLGTSVRRASRPFIAPKRPFIGSRVSRAARAAETVSRKEKRDASHASAATPVPRPAPHPMEGPAVRDPVRYLLRRALRRAVELVRDRLQVLGRVLVHDQPRELGGESVVPASRAAHHGTRRESDDEGHHGPGEDDEARFIAQSFVPETIVVSKGTNVIWFNGDVGHEHDIVVMSDVDSASPIYQTGEFTEFESRNYTFNGVGKFQYADTVEYDNGYIMRGNVSVTDDDGNTGLQRSMDEISSAGLMMVPTQDISQYSSDLQSRGFVIDSMHDFQDLRGGQSGTGDEQTLIVWRVPTDMQVSNVLSELAEVSSQLPYS